MVILLSPQIWSICVSGLNSEEITLIDPNILYFCLSVSQRLQFNIRIYIVHYYITVQCLSIVSSAVAAADRSPFVFHRSFCFYAMVVSIHGLTWSVCVCVCFWSPFRFCAAHESIVFKIVSNLIPPVLWSLLAQNLIVWLLQHLLVVLIIVSSTHPHTPGTLLFPLLC